MERYLGSVSWKIWRSGNSCSLRHLLMSSSSYCAPAVTKQGESIYVDTVATIRPISHKTLSERLEAAIESRDMRKVKGVLISQLKICASDFLVTTPAARVSWADSIMEQCLRIGIYPDVVFYNKLLQVYLYNDHKFLPSEFLQSMKKNDCLPNLLTFTLLLKAYCNRGSISSANRLMDFIKSSNLPIREHVYACLVTGHARDGNLSAAESVLDQMKEDQVPAGSRVYGSLMRAYIENGMLEKIPELCSLMKEEVWLIKDALDIMNTLSQCGHSNKMLEVLDLMQVRLNKEEFYSLLYSRMARGDMEASYIVLQKISEVWDVDEITWTNFVRAAYKNGVPLPDIVSKLQSVNCHRLYDNLVEVIIGDNVINMESTWSDCPDKDMLPKLKNSHNWISDSRYALQLRSTVKPPFHYYYYPLLARHCSDADVKESIITICDALEQTMFQNWENVKKYFLKTLKNADLTLTEFIQTQLAEDSTDEWLQKLLIIQFFCNNHSHVIQTLEKIKEVEPVLESTAFRRVLKRSDRTFRISGDVIDIMLYLSKHESVYPIVRKWVWSDKGLNLQLLKTLQNRGLVIPVDDLLTDFMKQANNINRAAPKQLWNLIKQRKHIPTPAQLAFIYQSAIHALGTGFSKSEIRTIYMMLPSDYKEIFTIRCYRVVDLFNSRMTSIATKEFFKLLSSNNPKSIPQFVWGRVIVSAYAGDLELGDELYKKMRETHHTMSLLNMRDLVKTFMFTHNNLERAEGVLQEMVATYGDRMVHHYVWILPYLAEHKMWDKIEEVAAMGVLPTVINQAKVIALLADGKVEEALQLASTVSLGRLMVLALVRVIVSGISSPEQWREHLVQSGVPLHKFDSILMFAYIDAGQYDKAKQIAERLNYKICSDEVMVRMRSPSCAVYQEWLKKWNVSYIRESYQDASSIDGYENVTLDSEQLHMELLELDKDDLDRVEGTTTESAEKSQEDIQASG